MKNNFKDEVNSKYNEIFKKLHTQWKLQSKNKYNEIFTKGIENSGVGSKAMYMLMEELINKSICEFKELFINLQMQYNRKMSSKELNEYKEKTFENIVEYINNIEQEIKQKYDNSSLSIVETNQVFINNLKCEAENKIIKIFDEIVNY